MTDPPDPHIGRALIVAADDELAVSLSGSLRAEGHDVAIAADPRQAADALSSGGFNLAVVDVATTGQRAVHLLTHIREIDPLCPVIAVGDQFDEAASDAIRLAATDNMLDFLPAPAEPQDVALAARHALAHRSLLLQNPALAAEEQLRRQRPRQRVEEEATETATLAEIERLAHAQVDDTEAYEAVAAQVRALLRFDRIDVTAVDVKRGLFTHIFVRGRELPGRSEGEVVPLPGTLTEAVVKSGSPLLLEPEPPEALRQRFPGSHFGPETLGRSSISVPLLWHDAIVGLLHLLSWDANPYTQQDVTLAERIGERIAPRVARAGLRVALQLFQTAMESATELVVITDHDGAVEYVNPAFTRVTGYERSEAVGQTPRFLKSGRQDADFYREMWETILGGNTWSGHLVNRRKDGTEYTETKTVSPLPPDAFGRTRFLSMGTDDTERVLAEEALRRSQNRLVEAERIAHVGSWEWDTVANELVWSDEMYRIFGVTPEEFGGTYETFISAVHPDDRDYVEKSVDAALLEKEPYDVEYRVVLPHGSERTVHALGWAVFDDEGRPVRMIGTVQDITEQKHAEEALRASESRQRAFVDAVPDMLFRVSADGTFLDFRPGRGATPYAPPDQFIGRRIEDVMPPDVAGVLMERISTAIRRRELVELEYQMIQGGVVRDYETRFVAIGDDEAVAIVRDVTERRRTREETDRVAMTDTLTGLPNQRRLSTLLDDALAEAKSRGQQGALLYLDVDRTAMVNAAYGNVAGDQLIRSIGRTLRRAARGADTVARVEGDEFAVVLRQTSRDAAHSNAGQLLERVSRVRISAAGESVGTTASMGIVAFPMGDASTDDLLVCAHIAARRAKEAGRNRAAEYEPAGEGRASLSALQRTRSLVEGALDHGRVHLLRQPIVSVSDRSLLMYEVLLRLEDEHGTIMMPGDFMPHAEALDLSERIDRTVVEAACSRWRKYADAGAETPLSLNISARSIGPDMAAYIHERAGQWRVSPEALTIEVTETAPARTGRAVSVFFEDLRERGFKLAVDDFGSGNTSLTQLRGVRFDYLKVDGALVRESSANPVDRELLRAYSGVARALGVRVIAEQVEDAEAMEFIRDIGVDYAQGYFLGRPEEFPAEPVTA